MEEYKDIFDVLNISKKQATPADSKAIYAMFSRAGIKDKEIQRHIIGQYTYGRTSHTSEMLKYEVAELKGWLQGQALPGGKADEGELMRRKIIHFAHLMGWKNNNGSANMQRINEWCKKYGQFHKPLNAHTADELKKLVTQFKKVFESYLTKEFTQHQ